MNRITRYAAYTTLATSVFTGCNFLARTAEGLCHLGERMYTGTSEDIDSLRSNYKKDPHTQIGKKHFKVIRERPEGGYEEVEDEIVAVEEEYAKSNQEE